MPLTFAHPAAILPLARWLPLSALAVGAMMPDVPYFVLVLSRDHFGHTLGGLFWFCVPAGALVLWAFHAVVKRPLVRLAPRAAQERLWPVAERFRVASSSDALRVGAALLVGAASHVAWDAFTHRSGWGVALVPALNAVATLGPLSVEVPRVIQHASTLVGLGVMAAAAARWWGRAPRVAVGRVLPARYRAVWLSALVAIPVALGIAYAAQLDHLDIPRLARRLVVGTAAAMAVGLVVYGTAARRLD